MHMSLALWFAAAALALLFAATGVMKLFESREMLVADGQRWAASASPTFIRALGAAEILGAFGLVLPGIVGVLPQVTAVAAAGLGVIMAGAAVVHIRRGEQRAAAFAVVLLAVTVWIAWDRAGAVPF
ncbi:DoxX family protein [Nakamurella flava]|jgi:uncharacterized membrane protein YphA (DoxX/SURF4 family)|nr:DoxX family protein [Nakamurella flava]